MKAHLTVVDGGGEPSENDDAKVECECGHVYGIHGEGGACTLAEGRPYVDACWCPVFRPAMVAP